MSSTAALDAPVAPAVKPAPRNKAPLVLAGLLITATVVGGAYKIYGLHKESTDDAFVEGRVVNIASRVTGQVVKVLVQDNQEVNEGDVLVELDPLDLEARRDAAAADLISAQAQLENMKAQLALTQRNVEANLTQAQGGLGQANSSVEASRASLDQSKADISAAEARFSLASTELKRSESLFATGSISRAEVDIRRSNADQAQASLELARARFAATRANIDGSVGGVTLAKGRILAAQAGPQQIEAARAAVGVAEARVKQAEAAKTISELNLSFTKVRAPSKGVVSKRTVEVGALVDPARALMSIVSLHDVWVVANFKEDQLREMKPGDKASIEVDTFSGKRLTAHVESIAAGTGSRFALLPPDNASGNFVKVVQRVPVLIRFDDALPFVIRPGMSANVTVRTAE